MKRDGRAPASANGQTAGRYAVRRFNVEQTAFQKASAEEEDHR